jgi:hypothetical protein
VGQQCGFSKPKHVCWLGQQFGFTFPSSVGHATGASAGQVVPGIARAQPPLYVARSWITGRARIRASATARKDKKKHSNDKEARTEDRIFAAVLKVRKQKAELLRGEGSEAF